MYMPKLPVGYRPNDQATVTIVGTLGENLSGAYIVDEQGNITMLPARATVGNPPMGKHASVPAGTLSWRTE